MKESTIMKKNYLDPEFNILSLATSSEFLSASPQPGGANDGWLGDDNDYENGGNSGDGWA